MMLTDVEGVLIFENIHVSTVELRLSEHDVAKGVLKLRNLGRDS